MSFSEIQFYNFRNIQNKKIFFKKKNIFLIGNNGQGKTNILEAIYVLKYGASFRPRKEQHFIKFDNKECALRCIYKNKEDEDIISYQFVNSKIKIKINGNIIRDRTELFEFAPVIIFNHDDILIINGAPDNRRKFFDQSISLYNINYIENLRNYKKILKQRNSLLKENNIDYIDIIDAQLIEFGKKLIEERKNIVNLFNEKFSTLYNKISGTTDKMVINYKPSWNVENDLYKSLKNKLKQDLIYKTTTTGPHRDKYIFMENGYDFSKIGSTGQKRLLALILKLRQANFLFEKTNQNAILLFDDVLLELDGTKRINFLENIPEYRQAVFTFLPEEPYNKYFAEDREIFYVTKGDIELNEKNS